MATGQTITLPVPSGHGSLEQYIHTVNSIPMLTPEEEHNLAERKISGDVEAAKQLILSHLRVVVSIARRADVASFAEGATTSEEARTAWTEVDALRRGVRRSTGPLARARRTLSPRSLRARRRRRRASRRRGGKDSGRKDD